MPGDTSGAASLTSLSLVGVGHAVPPEVVQTMRPWMAGLPVELGWIAIACWREQVHERGLVGTRVAREHSAVGT